MVYSLDDGPKLSAAAVAVSENQLIIPLTNSVALFQAFRRGRVLKFETAQGTIIPFDLTNSSVALDAALECARRWTLSQQAERRTSPGRESVYVQPEALRPAASTLLAEAGTSDYKFLAHAAHDIELAWEYSDRTRATLAIIRPEAKMPMERFLAATIERHRFLQGTVPKRVHGAQISSGRRDQAPLHSLHSRRSEKVHLHLLDRPIAVGRFDAKWVQMRLTARGLEQRPCSLDRSALKRLVCGQLGPDISEAAFGWP